MGEGSEDELSSNHFVSTQRRKNITLAVYMAAAFLTSFAQFALIPAQKSIMDFYGLPAANAQWVTSIYMLVMGVTIPLTGFLMKRFQSRTLFYFSMAIFTIGSIGTVIDAGFPLMIISRMFQAVGTGILFPLIQVVVFRLYPKERRGRMMGYVAMAQGFAPALSPAVCGVMIDVFGWRSILYLILAMGILLFVCGLIFLRNKDSVEHQSFEAFSFVLVSLGFISLMFGAGNIASHGIVAWETLLPVLAGAAAVIVFAIRQLRLIRGKNDPLLDIRAFKNVNFALGACLLMFIYGNMVTGLTCLSLFIVDAQELPAYVYGLIVLPASLTIALLGPLTGRILDKHGAFWLTIVGLLVFGAGNLLLASMNENTPIILTGIYFFIRTLGLAAIFQPLVTWAVNSLPASLTAHGTAIVNTLRQSGGALVNTLAISLVTIFATQVSEYLSLSFMFAIIAVVAFIGLAVFVVVMRKGNRSEN